MLIESKDLLKWFFYKKKNHGDKHNTKLLLTVVTVIEHISGYVHIKYFWILEIHQRPLHHHPRRLLQGDQLSEGHHVHPGAGHTPPKGGGRNPAGRGNPGHGDQPTGGRVRVCHQGNWCNVLVKNPVLCCKSDFCSLQLYIAINKVVTGLWLLIFASKRM